MTCKNCGFKSCRCYDSLDLDSEGESIYVSDYDDDSDYVYNSLDESSSDDDSDYVYNSLDESSSDDD